LSSTIKMERTVHPPNKRTFTIKPIKKLIQQEKTPGIWLDPFQYPYTEDALVQLKRYDDCSVDGVLFDPPYSPRQLKECYDDIGESWNGQNTPWSLWQQQISRIIKPGGKCIKFGWNTGKISKHFEIIRLMIVNHGSHHNDTIVTVQKRTQGRLFN